VSKIIRQIEQLILSQASPLEPWASTAIFLGIAIVLLSIVWLVRTDSRKRVSPSSPAPELPQQPAATWQWLVPLLLLMGIGAAVRFLKFDASLNHMEVYIPGIPLPDGISEPPPRLDWFSALTWGFFKEPHPVGFFLAMFGWTKLFGIGVAALRMPSALLGVLSIPVVFRLGKLVYDWKVGLIAAGFLALHGFHIHTSVWARMFVPETFLGLIATWLLIEILRARRRRGILEGLYVLTMFVGFNTEWFFWPLIGTHFVWALLHYKKDGETARLLYLQVLSMLLGAFTLSQVAATAGLAASGSRASFRIFREYFSFGIFYNPGLTDLHPRHWPITLIGFAFIVSLALLWRAFAIKPAHAFVSDTVTPLPKLPLLGTAAGMTIIMAALVPLATTYIAKTKYLPQVAAIVVFPALALLGLPVAAILGPWARSCRDALERRYPSVSVLTSPIGLLAVFPFLMVCAAALARPMVDRQALVIFIPYLLILIAAGTREFARRRSLAIPLAIVLPLLFAASAWHFLWMPQSYRDYASLARELNARMSKEDVVFVIPAKWYVTPLFYYVDKSRLVAADYAHYSAKPNARVWVVLFEDEQPAPMIQDAITGLSLSGKFDVSGGQALLYERL
jgi:hypothetical protein